MPKLLIGGDICPTESNYELFEKADIKSLLGDELTKMFGDADYCFLNLEAALTDGDTPIRKAGPNLKAPAACAIGLKKINPFLFGLANNHILDHGQEGFQSTLATLTRNGVSFTGIGENLESANRGYIASVGDVRVGFYCCAEHEFTIATDTEAGANPFDPLYSLDAIYSLSQGCDYCVVIYHGGKEYYRYPSPRLQKVCRRIAEKGADLVVCQHSHCVGCMEDWDGSTIVYGQGNFLFDRGDDEFWNSSLLIEVEFINGKQTVTFLPLRKYGNGVRLDTENGNETLAGFQKRSREILEPGFVKRKYSSFADELGNHSIYYLLNRSHYLERILNKLSGYRRGKKYKWKDNFVLLNYMECEAWRELCITAMRDRI